MVGVEQNVRPNPLNAAADGGKVMSRATLPVAGNVPGAQIQRQIAETLNRPAFN